MAAPLRLTEAEYKRLLAGQPIGSPKRSKYGARKMAVDGIVFDSEFEARHYQGLKLRQIAGEVRALRTHVVYELKVDGVLVCKYEADFVYEERQAGTWQEVIEDTKSEPTRRKRTYRIKHKLMAALGHHIREVMNARTGASPKASARARVTPSRLRRRSP